MRGFSSLFQPARPSYASRYGYKPRHAAPRNFKGRRRAGFLGAPSYRARYVLNSGVWTGMFS